MCPSVPSRRDSYGGVMFKAQMTVVSSVYFQSPEEQPIQTEYRYTRPLASEEQPYARSLKVGPEWVLLDCGWVREAALVVLENLEGTRLQKVPTEEERVSIDSRVVEISFSRQDPSPALTVRPGGGCQFEPTELTSIRVRCRDGVAKCSLLIIPA